MNSHVRWREHDSNETIATGHNRLILTGLINNLEGGRIRALKRHAINKGRLRGIVGIDNRLRRAVRTNKHVAKVKWAWQQGDWSGYNINIQHHLAVVAGALFHHQIIGVTSVSCELNSRL